MSNQPPLVVASVARDSHLGQPRTGTGSQFPPLMSPVRLNTRVWGATRCVTPRQTCPRPNGFRRNLRSKTRWFTGFCNSHQVSQFATFFIDARAEISVAESRFCLFRYLLPSCALRVRRVERQAILFLFSLALLCARGCLCARRTTGGRCRARSAGPWFPPSRTPVVKHVLRSSASQDSTMILPQVHLRKPCYDFSFL